MAFGAGFDGATSRKDSAGVLGCWKREPFTSESAKHISVWEKA